MPRKKGMLGPGSMKMGGVGAAPRKPPTVSAGRPRVGAPAGLLGGGGGGGPPPPPMGGPAPGGAPVAKSPMGGMGGAAGFKKGGETEIKKHARGGAIEGSAAEEKKETPAFERKEHRAFAKGGMVGGGDAKGRVGRDRATGGKAC